MEKQLITYKKTDLKDRPLLSICIPTYNRAEILEKTLSSITSQKLFQSENSVEIVVSDNNSNDGTEAVAKKYTAKYANKIKYFRNKENVRDLNFYYALKRGNGCFIKLSNDTAVFEEGSLEYLVGRVKENLGRNKFIFFSNRKESSSCEVNLDGFIQDMSFYFTWIGCLGLWRHDLSLFTKGQFIEWSKDSLMQCHVVLRLIEKYGTVIIYNRNYCNICTPSLSGSYDLSKVFIYNYLSILNRWLSLNLLSKKTFDYAKWDVLKYHVLPRQFNYKYKFSYNKQNFWKYTELYHNSLYFYYLILRILFKKVTRYISYPIKRIKNIFKTNNYKK